MIGREEIRRRAGALGLLEGQLERDYVLNHVLAAIAESRSPIIFRGGTALARVYWPDFRLSEDLDFITDEGSDVESVLRGAVQVAVARTGIAIRMDGGRFERGIRRFQATWEGGSLQIDVLTGERAAIATQRLPLHLPYSDLAAPVRKITVVALEEILATKWWMLDDRAEPRDLFDLWTGLCVRGVPVQSVADAFRAIYGYAPAIESIQRAARRADAWDIRLRHQVRGLPPFGRVLDEVLSVVARGRARGSAPP